MSVLLSLAASDAQLVGEKGLRHSENPEDAINYFSVPSGYGKNYYIPPPSIARFTFSIPKSDKYMIWVMIKSPAPDSQGFYIHDGRGRWFTWLAGIRPEWSWVKITDSITFAPMAFDFMKGMNEFQMGWCDEDVKVAQLLITNDPDFVPGKPSSGFRFHN